MKRVLTCKQMRDADSFTIDKLGISSQELIERAGTAVAEVILSRFKGGRVLVCIGVGNNGEDGKVVADILSKNHGFKVETLFVKDGDLSVFENKFDIIVDCIFGTGLTRNVEGRYEKVVNLINKSESFVISCDIPSGLNSDTGRPMGICVMADLTVAIQEYKFGHFLNDGIDYSGNIIAKDIGISIWGDDFAQILNDSDISKFFEKRKRNVHKGCFGKCAVIGGSKRYFGSALLSLNAFAGLKIGAGYSYLVVPNSLFSIYAGLNPECIVLTVPDKDGFALFDSASLDELLSLNCISVGTGMGVSEDIYLIIKYLLKNYNGTLVIDADGLNSLSKYGVDALKNKRCKVVLLPHVGEFSRLTQIDKDVLQESPVVFAEKFAKEYNVVVCLKSATTVITDGEQTFINITGCSGMAKAGSGDVLCGLTLGLLARVSEDITEVVAASTYLFGKCGEYAQKEYGEYSVTATDIIDAIPKVLRDL